MAWLLILVVVATPGTITGFSDVGVAAVSLNISGVNDVLKQHDVSTLSGYQLGISSSGFDIFERRILLGISRSEMSQLAKSNDLKLKSDYTLTLFEGGFILPISNSVWTYSLIGAGMDSYSLRIKPMLAPMSLDSLMEDPGRFTEVNNENLVLSFSLGIIYAVPIMKKLAIGIQLKVGYIYSPWDSEWIEDGISVLDGPSFGSGGPYISLSGLAGGFRE